MFLIFGSSNYGKTDHLPGLFYIKTRFFHLWWLPLVPFQSIVFVDDGTESHGAEVGFRWKSVFTAWLRTIAGFAFVSFVIRLIYGNLLVARNEIGSLKPQDSIELVGIAVLMAGIYYVTVFWSRPSYRRALKLADEIGFPSDLVKAEFPTESVFEPTSI